MTGTWQSTSLLSGLPIFQMAGRWQSTSPLYTISDILLIIPHFSLHLVTVLIDIRINTVVSSHIPLLNAACRSLYSGQVSGVAPRPVSQDLQTS